MKKNSPEKKSKAVESSLVSQIVNTNMQPNNVGGVNSTKIENKYGEFFTMDDNKKVVIGSVVAIILIVLVILIIFLMGFFKKDKEQEPGSKTLYEEAYEQLSFEENTKLKKLTCKKTTTEESMEVNEEETRIYYFDHDEVDAMIFHNDIVLSENYIDYYETMVKEYQKSLKEDYQYDNVKTNIIEKDNEMLITIIADNKKETENKLGAPNFVNYEDAKMTMIDSGYTCK